jgi:ABC-type uncharacterized transport system fused permease/ATPase subunit
VALGHTELLLVTGYSGIGKTSLVRVIHTLLWFNRNGHLNKGGKIEEGGVP